MCCVQVGGVDVPWVRCAAQWWTAAARVDAWAEPAPQQHSSHTARHRFDLTPAGGCGLRCSHTAVWPWWLEGAWRCEQAAQQRRPRQTAPLERLKQAGRHKKSATKKSQKPTKTTTLSHSHARSRHSITLNHDWWGVSLGGGPHSENESRFRRALSARAAVVKRASKTSNAWMRPFLCVLGPSCRRRLRPYAGGGMPFPMMGHKSGLDLAMRRKIDSNFGRATHRTQTIQ